MPGLFSRVKNWIAAETLTYSDLNAEFNNIINKFEPQYMDDISSNTSAFQTVQDPGTVGNETLPVNLQEEIRTLRSMIKKITGESVWYTPPDSTIASLSGSSGIIPARTLSGREDANGMPQVLTCTGASLVLTADGSPTNLVFAVEDVQYTLTSDITLTLSAAPSSNNTATVDNSNFTTLMAKIIGETEGAIIRITSVGSEITTLLNKMIAFTTTNGGNTEYSIGVVRQTGSLYYLENCRRGFFFNSSGTGIRSVLASGSTITLLKLHWIFIKSDNTLSSTTNEPKVSATEPSSPSSEDFWYDLSQSKWKTYSSGSFIDSECTFLGWAAASSTVIVGVRTADFNKTYSPLCDVALMRASDTVVRNYRRGGKVNIYGTNIDFILAEISFNMASDLDSGVSEAASTFYYFYITNSYTFKISDVAPYDRMADLKGHYHPHKAWRCLGVIFNNSSQNFSTYMGNLGSEDYISDHSLSLNKLRPYLYNSGDGAYPGSIGQTTFSITATGNTSAVKVVTSGRPIMIIVGPGEGMVLGGIATDESVVMNLKVINLNGESVGSYTSISGDITFSHEQFPDSVQIPLSFSQMYFAPAGVYQFRVEFTITGVTLVNGALTVYEI